MPTYQYVCTECGNQLEVVQKFSDSSLTVHEECGGRLRKVFSPVGIVFKGSGFYRNDSRSGSPGAPAAKPGADKPAGESSKPAESSSSSSGEPKSGGDSSSSTSTSSSSSSDGSSSSSSSGKSSSGKSSSGKSSGEKVA